MLKGSWHASHAHLDADDGDGLLQSIDDDGTPINDNIQKYLKAETCSTTSASRSGSAPSRTDLASATPAWSRTKLAADETIALLRDSTQKRATRRRWRFARFLNPRRRLAVRRPRAQRRGCASTRQACRTSIRPRHARRTST